MGAVSVRPAEAGDKEKWLELWLGYNAFYGVEVPAEVTETTWARIMDPAYDVGCLVAAEWPYGEVLGFANYVVHPRTWSLKNSCYLEDLFVTEAARGNGIGKLLCEAVKHMAERRGLSQVYWNTRESNAVARGLYDQIAQKDDFVRYVLPLESA
ncbi:MAG: GNAT family N-acetyltransferase [Proteobacteria bacterium]|nr:GNAT family N-acetyltransferase [Pseudomonadota bacterium]